jgi:hypothetical protein
VTPGGAVQAEVLGEAAAKPGKAKPGVAKPAVAGEVELAVTGAQVTQLLWTMMVLIVAGLALLTMGRRRAPLGEDRQTR